MIAPVCTTKQSLKNPACSNCHSCEGHRVSRRNPELKQEFINSGVLGHSCESRNPELKQKVFEDFLSFELLVFSN